jgi:polyhydroxyalkanoate synthesis regulator phasin
MNAEKIKERIKELATERDALQLHYSTSVQQNQKMNQDFQQAMIANQTRFAQLTGAIDELKQLTASLNGQ